MKGDSLISDELNQKPIWAFTPTSVVKEEGQPFMLDLKMVRPSFYSIWTIGLTYCQNWYQISLWNHEFWNEELAGYVNPCSSDELLSNKDALRMMIDRMKENGFDVTSLENVSLSR